MVLNTKSIIYQAILLISLSIISAGWMSSDAKKLANLKSSFMVSVYGLGRKETVVLADELLYYFQD